MGAMLIAGCGTDSAPGPDMVVSDVQWVTFQGMSIPTGAEGPSAKDAVVPTGYDPSPAGAVLAAVSATVRMSVADDTQWPSVGNALVAPGAARDSWAIARAQISIENPVRADQAPDVVAYAIGEHSADRVTVSIYSRLSDQSVTENRATAVWMAGDWRLSLPDAADHPPVRALAEVPATATPFKEV